jgi:hypothetical protein
MALAQQGRSITFTAITDKVDFGGLLYNVVAMSFQGGVGGALTAGQRLVVRDTGTVGTGNILADYLTEGTTDNADLWGGRNPQPVKGLSIDNNTLAGTWVLTVTRRHLAPWQQSGMKSPRHCKTCRLSRLAMHRARRILRSRCRASTISSTVSPMSG